VCGRYVLVSPGDAIAAHFRLAAIPVYPPRYNIAPTQEALVVRETPAGDREAVFLRWGLIPFWAKDPSIGSRLINARAEGVVDKPAFRAAFRRRRCLVPADGFFEWRSSAGGRKQPYYIRLASGAQFAMAGLWEHWRPSAGAPEPGAGSPSGRGEASAEMRDLFEDSGAPPPAPAAGAAPASPGEAIATFTIVTTAANAELRALHDRMPVLVAPADYDEWLSSPNPSALLGPWRGEAFEITAIGIRVNDVRNDDPELLRPVPGV
jgi:putative SOS response-associated peptidase YedK